MEGPVWELSACGMCQDLPSKCQPLLYGLLTQSAGTAYVCSSFSGMFRMWHCSAPNLGAEQLYMLRFTCTMIEVMNMLLSAVYNG